jgi:hypothetical protein
MLTIITISISSIRFKSSLFSICFRIKRLVGIEENISEYAPYCISPAVTKQELIILSNVHLQKLKPVLGNICNIILDSIETLNAHNRMEHSEARHSPAGVS